ncbi:hypothetical protein GCM10022286_18870 [Gryllotalpicola daejeonensis]|uniref:Lipoprotein n=1 Tax=Gryllotalpicola daejeonensis TaxID=993087 RepID=A0ABP7ZKB6_9MICO
MNTSALTKSAAAITLAALTVLGAAACSSGAAKSAGAKAEQPSASASGTPKPGIGTKTQCMALEAKLLSSAGGLQSAITTLSSGGDPSRALPALQSFATQLQAQADKATDPALQPVAHKVETDYTAFVATAQAASDAYAAKNPAAVQAQAAKLKSQESTLQSDVGALRSVCD